MHGRIIHALFSTTVVLATLAVLSSCSRGTSGTNPESPQDKKFVFHSKPTAAVTFLSTQMSPVEEAAKMRNVILKDFPGTVEFKPNDSNFLLEQMESTRTRAGSASILVGALHGDLVKLHEQGELQPLDAVYGGLENRSFSENLLRLSRLDGNGIFYIPWMQASFVMVANKKALLFLPQGAKLGELTYAQLEEWAKNIFDKTGLRAMGFPAGGKGLMHRFFQGYLYPSFTGSTLVKFRGADARKMWSYFRNLWRYVQPGSLVYSTMADPLLAGDVLIAWDHTARLVKVFEERPGDFVAFPAPIGPKGRGFMPVLSGLAIPRDVADVENAALLIDYLTDGTIQNRTLVETGFFPVLESDAGNNLPASLRELNAAVRKQAASANSVTTLLPIGLGAHGMDFNNYYMLTFSGIVLEGKDIGTVLDLSLIHI